MCGQSRARPRTNARLSIPSPASFREVAFLVAARRVGAALASSLGRDDVGESGVCVWTAWWTVVGFCACWWRLKAAAAVVAAAEAVEAAEAEAAAEAVVGGGRHS